MKERKWEEEGEKERGRRREREDGEKERGRRGEKYGKKSKERTDLEIKANE